MKCSWSVEYLGLKAVGERQQKGCDETNNPENVYMRVMQVLTVQVTAGVPYLVVGIQDFFWSI